MKTRNILYCLLLVLCTGTSTNTWASHYMGLSMNYECLGGCTYRVSLNFLTGCGSVINQTPNNFAWVGDSSSCNLPVDVSGGWIAQPLVTLTPLCAPMVDTCDAPGASTFPYGKLSFYRDYNVCGVNCSTYKMTYFNCCRNPSYANSSGATSVGHDITVLDFNGPACNNSPIFCEMFITANPINQTSIINIGAIDPDGDSLVYRLGNCQVIGGDTVPLNPGYSAQQLLGPNFHVRIDSTNGDLYIVPLAGASVQFLSGCVVVDEYRNGVKIGEAMQEFRITTNNMPANIHVPVSDTLTNVTGGYSEGFHIYACTGNTIGFDIPITDPDSGTVFRIHWEKMFAGGSFYNIANPTLQDSFLVAGAGDTHFEWTPPGPGLYRFCYWVWDNSCPIQMGVSRQVVMHIGNIGLPIAVTDSVNCNMASFSVTPLAGTSPFTYLWTGPGGLSSNAGATSAGLSHTFQAPGTYPYSILVIDSTGCRGYAEDSVVIGPMLDSYANAVQDSCLHLQLQGTAIGGTGPFQYAWSLSSGATGTGSILAAAVPGPGTYHYTVTITDATGCVSIDTDSITIQPLVMPQITQNQDTLSAPAGTNYQWYLNGNAIAGANGPIWVADSTGDYTVWVTDSLGCEMGSDTIQISPINSVSSGIGPRLCRVFPNPNSGQFQLAFPEGIAGRTDVRILDIAGREIWKQSFPLEGNRLRKMDLEGVPAGLYFLQVRMGEALQVVRVEILE